MVDEKIKITYFVQCCFCDYRKQIMSSSKNKMYVIRKLLTPFASVKVHMGRKHKAEVEYIKYMMPGMFADSGKGKKRYA